MEYKTVVLNIFRSTGFEEMTTSLKLSILRKEAKNMEN